MNIEQFIQGYLNETSDPLKDNPNRQEFRRVINQKLTTQLSEYKNIEPDNIDFKRNVLSKIFKLLQFKYGAFNYAADFNKLYVGKHPKDISYEDIFESVNSAINDD